MISKKYYTNWWREAGRGHITAILSWGGYLIYFIMMLFELQINTEYTFFGIGNGQELLLLVSGIAFINGYTEFLYLLQKQKQDFYYSLPVRKSTIFWFRYLHGLCHGLLPLLLYMLFCGIYQGSIDADFTAYAFGYTFRSIAVYGMIFLVFYQIAVLSLTLCGTLASALFTAGVFLCSFQLIIQGVWLTFAKNIYRTFYKIPLAEKMQTVLVPWKLGQKMTGSSLFQKFEILEYKPKSVILLSALLWFLILFALTAAAQKKRKTEAVGKLWITNGLERGAEILLSIMLGLWAAGMLLDISYVTEKGLVVTAAALLITAAVTVLITHLILEKLIQMSKGNIFRYKAQIALEMLTVCMIIFAFLAVQKPYDTFTPKAKNIKAIGLCVNGLDMDRNIYNSIRQKEQYQTDRQLQKFTLSNDGKDGAVHWIGKAADQEHTVADKDIFTEVTVCYYLKNGTEKYRTYPLNEADFQEFSAVYESKEYKAAAYPLSEEAISEKQFLWTDGITEKPLILSDAEKEDFAKIYRKDIAHLKMSDLKEQLPKGFVELKSRTTGTQSSVVVYPFFENTCQFLTEHKIDPTKTISDYEIRFLQVTKNRRAKAKTDGSRTGGVTSELCTKPEEVKKWRDKLVPKSLDLQPLLCPMHDLSNAKAEVEDAEYQIPITVECTVR